MSDLDLSISNGTCYFATNRKAADTFIPCGNAANAAYTCCLKGDVCLEGSVCFHPDGNSGGTTYIAGCTDPGFGSVAGACPHKGKFSDQQIVGLVRCQDSNDNSKPDELWAGCPGDTAKTEMTGVPPPCSCSDPDYQGLFRQKPTIEAVATLPTALGQTVLFAKGHEPSPSFKQTSTPRAGGGSRADMPSSTTITINITSRSGSSFVTAAPTPSSSGFQPAEVPVSAANTSNGSDQGLSTGAKAGIAVGVILAVLLSSAILFLALTMRRRHRKLSGDAVPATATAAPPSADDAPGTAAAREPSPPSPPTAASSWDNNNPDLSMAATSTGNHTEEWFKPELPADSSTIVSMSPDPAATATGDEKRGYHNSSMSSPSEHLQSRGSMRDSRESNDSVSDTSSGYYHAGGGFQQQQQQQQHALRRSPFSVSPHHSGLASAGNKAMASISELQG
ncbi:hypothetical protein PG987_011043 [Apiospora arundinis]